MPDKKPDKKPDKTPPSEVREEVIQEILRQVEARLRRELKIGDQTLDQIEEQSQRIGEQIKGIIQEEGLGHVGTGYAGASLRCRHGHAARYAGLRPRQLITLSGSARLSRAYYHCAACGRGWCPTDERRGLGRGQCSRAVQALMARFASYLPYRTAAQEMAAVCGVRLATGTVERYAQAVGRRLQQEWEQAAQAREGSELPASEERPPRLHGTMDGVMAHVDGEWHEVKLGCVYQTDRAGKAVRGRYTATLANSAAFGKRMRVLAHRSGTDRCRDMAVVADGADWIWQETGKHFPRSMQIVDYYHVTEHLWEYAQARFGPKSAAGAAWMGEQKGRLLEDGVGEVLAAVASWAAPTQEAREVQRRLLGYLGTHQGRLRYKTFREAGYHIGSGVAESGCKNVVQQRMKGPGMRWGRDGAEAQLHLCAHWKSVDGRDFFDYTGPQDAH